MTDITATSYTDIITNSVIDFLINNLKKPGEAYLFRTVTDKKNFFSIPHL